MSKSDNPELAELKNLRALARQLELARNSQRTVAAELAKSMRVADDTAKRDRKSRNRKRR